MGTGEEAAQTTLQITSKATLITADVILAAIRGLNKVLINGLGNNKIKSDNKLKSGKQSVKYLSKHNVALDSIPVSNVDIKQMTSLLKKYGVDFSVVKNKKTNDYNLFFKGTDTAVISNVLEKIVGEQSAEKDEPKKSLKQQKEEAQEKAEKLNAEKAAEKAKDKTHEQQKNRSGREKER